MTLDADNIGFDNSEHKKQKTISSKSHNSKKTKREQTLATLLASSIHEIKNEFGLMLINVEKLIEDLDLDNKQESEVAQVRSKAASIGNGLSRILTTYKRHAQEYTPHIDQHLLEEILEDICLKHRLTEKAYDLSLSYHCDENLLAFFDVQLLTNVIDTSIYNAVKSGVDNIKLSADNLGDCTVIRIEDDGNGFPDYILKNQGQNSELNLEEGNTGLGLYFANQICEMHTTDNKKGYLRLQNNFSMSGACVSLFIPN